jgi:hypothetical protein
VSSLLKNLPYSAGKYYSRTYINTVKEKLSNEKYDVVIIDHSRLEWLNRFIESKYKTALIAHNIEHEIYLESPRVHTILYQNGFTQERLVWLKKWKTD